MEKDPLSEFGDFRCLCTIITPLGKEEFYSHGIDQVQSVWLWLHRLEQSIRDFEKESGRKCEYTFFIKQSDLM